MAVRLKAVEALPAGRGTFEEMVSIIGSSLSVRRGLAAPSVATIVGRCPYGLSDGKSAQQGGVVGLSCRASNPVRTGLAYAVHR